MFNKRNDLKTDIFKQQNRVTISYTFILTSVNLLSIFPPFSILFYFANLLHVKINKPALLFKVGSSSSIFVVYHFMGFSAGYSSIIVIYGLFNRESSMLVKLNCITIVRLNMQECFFTIIEAF